MDILNKIDQYLRGKPQVINVKSNVKFRNVRSDWTAQEIFIDSEPVLLIQISQVTSWKNSSAKSFQVLILKADPEKTKKEFFVTNRSLLNSKEVIIYSEIIAEALKNFFNTSKFMFGIDRISFRLFDNAAAKALINLPIMKAFFKRMEIGQNIAAKNNEAIAWSKNSSLEDE